MTRPIFLLAAFVATLGGAVSATPHAYSLDPTGSKVGFTWFFGTDAVKGVMPVDSADLTIDFDHLAASSVRVAVDVTGAKAGFPFADQAMIGPQVLDAGNHPQITFVSRQITPSATGATLDGDITIRGVTRPARFAAELFRQSGSAPTDLTHLVIQLTGSINRMDFGASGWPDMVGPQVELSILARISQVN